MMGCEYCGQNGKHDSRCPLYERQETNNKCSICKDKLYIGEEYIINNEGKYAHWECVECSRDLAKWLGYEIKTMGEDYV